MQPYLFPYLGYFQLINAVDKFVIYDDIAFIKQGWINRNFILLNGSKHLFTIPIQNISSNALINGTKVAPKPFNWQRKLLQTFKQAYKKAPFFKDVFPMIEKVIIGSLDKNISDVATQSIGSVMNYLSVKNTLVKSSSIYQNADLKNADRLIDICKKEAADIYINAIGGMELYGQHQFLENHIKLQFVQPALEPYRQFNHEFISGLSIIDVLMFNPVEKIKDDLLPMYSVI